MKAVICPVCKGSGVYQHPPEIQDAVIVAPSRPCHGCGGKGWVEVHEEQPSRGLRWEIGEHGLKPITNPEMVGG